MSSFNRIGSAKGISVTGGADVTGTGLPTDGLFTSNGWIRYTVAVSAAAVPQIQHNSVTLKLNTNVALVADGLYTFNFALPAGDTFTLRFSADNTARVLIVDTTSEGVI